MGSSVKDEVSEKQKALLIRVAYVCSRAHMSRERHYTATEKFRRRRSKLGITLIITTSVTAVGLLSMISGEGIKSLGLSPSTLDTIRFGAQLGATGLAFLNLAIAMTLTFLGLEEKIVRHEQSGHTYTGLRDEAISLAEMIHFNFSNDLTDEVERLEEKCNTLGTTSPRVPLKVHYMNLGKEAQKGTSDARFWFQRFTDTDGFIEKFIHERKSICVEAHALVEKLDAENSANSSVEKETAETRDTKV